MVTPSAAVVLLADSPEVSAAAASVRRLVGRVDFLAVPLPGKIAVASVTGVSVDTIATFAIGDFGISMGIPSILDSMASDIQTIIHTTAHTPITTYTRIPTTMLM